MKWRWCCVFLLFTATQSSPAHAVERDLLRPAVQSAISADRQLLLTLDSTRRLDPFGKLQGSLLAGGGSLGSDSSSYGKIRVNGQYKVNRFWRAGLDLAWEDLSPAGGSGLPSASTLSPSVLISLTNSRVILDLTLSRRRPRYDSSDAASTASGNPQVEIWSLQLNSGVDLSRDGGTWYYGPTLASSILNAAVEGVPAAPDMTVRLHRIAPGVFVSYLSTRKTVSVTVNLAVAQGIESSETSLGTSATALVQTANLTYAPSALSRVTFQWESRDRDGQSLSIGVIYHL